jgi:glycosyltransferase involved in cell wall biosynthesis
MISIIIPTYRSESNLIPLHARLSSVLSRLEEESEIIFVNDCSPDGTLEVLRALAQQDAHVRVVSLSRNFGQQIAISAGLRFCSGDAAVIMDDDLQDPPELIDAFIAKWREGYEVVYGIRRRRKESLQKRLAYSGFYKFLRLVSGTDIPPDSGDFGLIGREIIDLINSMPERSRFIRGLRAWVGFRQIGIEYERASRHSGEPAYNFRGMLKLAGNAIFSFSAVPLRLVAVVGAAGAVLSVLGGIATLCQRLVTAFWPEFPLATWPGFSTIVVAVLFLGGMQLVSIGILGEYIGRIYEEVKQRPMFVVEQMIGFDDASLLAARLTRKPVSTEVGGRAGT